MTAWFKHLHSSLKVPLFTVVFSLLTACAIVASPEQDTKVPPTPVATNDTEVTEPEVPVAPPETIQPAPAGDHYAVTRVSDGDTFRVMIDGREEAVRLIGVDTPETVDPRKPVQCFGQEASNYTKTTLANQKVRLVVDPSQGERDKYQRLLRYVYLEDGRFFNQDLIAGGYAHEYTYGSIPYQFQAEFRAAEAAARNANRGLWAPGVCESSTPATTSSSGVIKLSRNYICHKPGGEYYEQTTNFRPYPTMEECVAAGGRPSKR